jgi:histidinol-phosphate aminotransferase
MCRLLAAIPDSTILMLDEAYFDYGAIDSSYPPFLKMLEQSHVPWMVLRTFSKAYGLAGLRVGCAVASDASLISLTDRVRGPFNVNRLAQAAAVAALEDMDYVRECICQTTAERARVARKLQGLGYQPAPSLANFLFFNAREDASELAKRLFPYGVIVKPWREPGFTEHVRVSIGSPKHNDQFLAALAEARQVR